ncbi:hypothetical protein JZO77_16665 [Enterococcus hulanensis]|uniref:hypothetical protein n=1 Tax=Enterococcus hulanensis TaxID=2559929 RepID=UPI001A8BF558|nr:hypothetical protein [Enterococcus hulanensis]MBO0458367.1 hypothetical protein [Enterococcus hulanensis]
MIKVILCSIIVSGLVSLSIMKFHMRMIEKWMDDFFEKEQDYITGQLRKHYLRKEDGE